MAEKNLSTLELSVSQTRKEISEAAEKTSLFLTAHKDSALETGRRIRALAPKVIMTNARGTSDNAVTFLKYGLEIRAGLPVASIGPSVSSVYGGALSLTGAACISVSQSGRSPDLITAQRMARRQGALTIALVNDVQSPLAAEAECLVPLMAGPEIGIAATKSYICTLTAMASLMAGLTGDQDLANALDALPAQLDQAVQADWSALTPALRSAASVFTIGRGEGLAIAQEAALKIKEMTGQHAEAYSAAEVMHGPLRIVTPGFPVLAFLGRDDARATTEATLAALVARGARVFTVGGSVPGCTSLATVDTGYPTTGLICAALAFYAFIESYTVQIGLDPDLLPGLSKVTKTS